MDLLKTSEAAYKALWLRQAFSNTGVISSWGDEDVIRWYQAVEHKGKRPPEMKHPPPVDFKKAYDLTTGDCVVFSLQVDKEMEGRGKGSGQQVHTGRRGANVRKSHDDHKTLVVMDSSARRAFLLQDGKEHSFHSDPSRGEATTWKLAENGLTDGKGHLFKHFTAQEVWEKTSRQQWGQKTVIILFRDWSGDIGTFRGRIFFEPSKGKVTCNPPLGSTDAETLSQEFPLSDVPSVTITIKALDEFVEDQLASPAQAQWRCLRPSFHRLLRLWAQRNEKI
ncbi:MAG: hypothetical protein M1837_007101 [Sclerophora amabilis]|nr:MAG: hypothetical protein M1837_007101 [Sclerophora amabilis]